MRNWCFVLAFPFVGVYRLGSVGTDTGSGWIGYALAMYISLSLIHAEAFSNETFKLSASQWPSPICTIT